MRILWMWRTDLRFRNRTQYQRPLHIGRSSHELVFLVRKDVVLLDEIAATFSEIIRCPVRLPGFIDHLWFFLYGFWAFWRRREHLDALYSPPDYSILWAAIVKRLNPRMIWIADMWDDPRLYIALQERNPLRRWATRIFNYLVQRALKRADLVITIGVSAESQLPRVLVDEFSIDPNRILPVTNGVDLSMFHPNADGVTPASGSFTILYVGMVHWYQGVGVLLDAVEAVVEQVPQVKLMLVGPTSRDGSEWLEKRLSANPLAEHVEFKGVVPGDAIPQLIGTSDVCVHPFPAHADLENVYPVKLFEYLAMGKPVVATNLSAVRVIVTDGSNGLLVQPGNSQDMAKALIRLYQDDNLRQTLANQARESVMAFNWEEINRRVLDGLAAIEMASEALAGVSRDG